MLTKRFEQPPDTLTLSVTGIELKTDFLTAASNRTLRYRLPARRQLLALRPGGERVAKYRSVCTVDELRIRSDALHDEECKYRYRVEKPVLSDAISCGNYVNN